MSETKSMMALMAMRAKRFVAAAAIASALGAATGGCTAIHVTHNGAHMVEIENNGWFLFNLIPLASGNTDDPESGVTKLFQNSVKLDHNIELINYVMRREGAVGVRDMITYTTDEYVLFVLLKRHSMHTSARLVMPGDEEEDAAWTHRVESKLERDPEGAKVATPPEPQGPNETKMRKIFPVRNEPADSRPPGPTKFKVFDF